jgi:hypothetical protein
MYGDVKEIIPYDAPVPREKEIDLRLNSKGAQGLGLSST